jgi:hypothetical protein
VKDPLLIARNLDRNSEINMIVTQPRNMEMAVSAALFVAGTGI